MSDDLREQLASAFASDAAGTLDSTPAPAASDPLPGADAGPALDGVKAGQTIPGEATPKPAGDGRARNPDGTFAPKAADAPPAEAKPSAFAEKPEDAPKVTPPAPPERVAPPPQWKGAGKVEWARLPVAVQQELAQDYTRLESATAKAAEFDRIIGPRAAQLAAEYGSVPAAVEQLLNLSDFAARQPQQFLQWFAQTRGIAAPTGHAPAPQVMGIPPELAPVLTPLQRQIDSLTQQLSERDRQTQEAAFASSLQAVQAFAADPAHPYFNDVQQDMLTMIEASRATGREISLKDAYDRAVWANPTVRAQMLQQERAQEERTRREQAEAARRNGAVLNGSPVPGANTSASNPAATVRDELMRAFSAGRA